MVKFEMQLNQRAFENLIDVRHLHKLVIREDGQRHGLVPPSDLIQVTTQFRRNKEEDTVLYQQKSLSCEKPGNA